MNSKKIKPSFIKYNNIKFIFEKYFRILSGFSEKIFIIFLVIYLILLLIEQLWENPLKGYIDLNYILIFLVISGIIYSLSIRKDKIASKKYEIKRKDIFLIIILGIIGSYLIWLRIKEWQILSYFISISLGIFIMCFLYLFLKNE